MASEPTPEQAARDMLERLGMDDAQPLTAADGVELANLIAEVRRLRAFQANIEESAFLHGFSIFPRTPPKRK